MTKKSSVFSRAWDGFVGFYREFSSGPYKKSTPKKNIQTFRKTKALKKKLPKRAKFVNNKPPKQELKEELTLLYEKRSPPEEFENQPNWNSVLKEEEIDEKRAEVTPSDRVKAIEKSQVEPKVRERVRHMLEGDPVSRKRKHLLFMNPGSKKILEAIQAAKTGLPAPVWTEPFSNHLTVDGNTLYFDDLEMATEETKRTQVKLLYFDPKKASTIQPITDDLREKFANITKNDVRRILRSLETYQRNFRRRLMPKVLGRMSLTKPGVIMMDTFYPSRKIDGWHGNYSLLTCMDAWSRYSRVYVLERKDKETVLKGMKKFMAEFASKGHLPRMILADKGSELAGASQAMEPYRKKPGKLVFNSVTGQPVLMVENIQSQYQRRMAVFRTASLTDDPSVIMDDISNHLNDQKRPDRGNLTPNQLLTLNPSEILKINDLYKTRTEIPEMKGLRALKVGHHVRILLMTRKEQKDTSQKGFRAKWSRRVYTVLKKTALQLNPKNFRYYVGLHQSYYRHELLWVPKDTDTQVLHGLVGKKSSLIGEAGTEWSEDEDYEPD